MLSSLFVFRTRSARAVFTTRSVEEETTNDDEVGPPWPPSFGTSVGGRLGGARFVRHERGHDGEARQRSFVQVEPDALWSGVRRSHLGPEELRGVREGLH